jgi:ABC-type nitrate/sulfonate/bicarbonate transport system substrate-binding protein
LTNDLPLLGHRYLPVAIAGDGAFSQTILARDILDPKEPYIAIKAMKPGFEAREDFEYERCGVANIFLVSEQLKGKIVGTERPGSPVAYGTLVALRKLGLTAKDVQLRILGGSEQITAALLTGQIVAGAAAPPVSFQLDRAGFHPMAATLDQPYQNVGVVMRRARMDELAPRLVPLLRAVRAGIDRYYSDKTFTMKVIAKYTKEKDPDIIDRTYEFYRRAGFRRELMISEPGIQGILDFLSETVPEAKKAAPGQFFDDRFVRQLNSAK